MEQDQHLEMVHALIRLYNQIHKDGTCAMAKRTSA